VLETAAGHLTLSALAAPTTLLRLRQAIRRHPDLEDLLEPVESEIHELAGRAEQARASVQEAIGLVWNG
jgi:hypothetical protein